MNRVLSKPGHSRAATGHPKVTLCKWMSMGCALHRVSNRAGGNPSAQAPPLTPHLEPVKHLGEKPTHSCLCSRTTEISTVYEDVMKPMLFSEATFPSQRSVLQQ